MTCCAGPTGSSCNSRISSTDQLQDNDSGSQRRLFDRILSDIQGLIARQLSGDTTLQGDLERLLRELRDEAASDPTQLAAALRGSGVGPQFVEAINPSRSFA